ncbi:hypothetical protein O3M35_002423 [Rhynocoris fuscipes]|uniref:Uncharacterized protein n=1 Tax=Rhynocoris fuscipes TaxID=488301 RepID=A0AAW1CPE0_9HEMI
MHARFPTTILLSVSGRHYIERDQYINMNKYCQFKYIIIDSHEKSAEDRQHANLIANRRIQGAIRYIYIY